MLGAQLGVLKQQVDAAAAAAGVAETAEAACVQAAQQHNSCECELYDELCSVQDYRDVLFDAMTWPELLRLRVDTLRRTWVNDYLCRIGYTIRPVDIAAVIHVFLLRRFCSIEGARIVLPRVQAHHCHGRAAENRGGRNTHCPGWRRPCRHVGWPICAGEYGQAACAGRGCALGLDALPVRRHSRRILWQERNLSDDSELHTHRL